MRWLLLSLLLLLVSPAAAQDVLCPTRPMGDSTNACASTQFVQQATGGTTLTLPLTVPNGGTAASSFTAGLPLIGNGANGILQGTISGNTTSFGTTAGTLTPGHGVFIDANGNLADSGGPPVTNLGSGPCDFINSSTSVAGCLLNYFNVKAYGAKGDASTNDFTSINNAITAAAAVCGTVFFPQGHYMVLQQVAIPNCVNFLGVGHPNQFTFAGQLGSIIDFNGIAAATDGFAGSLSQSTQAVSFEHLQFERATRDCMSGAFVYSHFTDVVFAYCGRDGFRVTGITGGTYQSSISNSLFYSNSNNGLNFAIATFGQQTTWKIDTSYAFYNGASGIVANNVVNTIFVNSAADHNGTACSGSSSCGLGFAISTSKAVVFESTDAESNYEDGYYIDVSEATLVGVTGAANNTGAVTNHTNFLLADGASNVFVIGGEDRVSSSLDSINAVSPAVVWVMNGAYTSALAGGAGLVKLGSLGVSCSGSPTASFATIGSFVTHC